MEQQDERRHAAEALDLVTAHQERARRAARVPWWAYLVMFVLTAGIGAANDFIDLNGAKALAGAIAVLLVVVLLASFLTRSAPLSHLRGVQGHQTFVPQAFVVVVVFGAVGAWLISRYGTTFTHDLANAVGLRDYPNTVTGVVYGAAFTALFALGRLMVDTAQRRNAR